MVGLTAAAPCGVAAQATPAVEGQPAQAPEAFPNTEPVMEPAPAPVNEVQPALPAPASVEEKPSAPAITVQAGKGLTVTSPDNKFAITLRARMQLRDTFQHDDKANTNEAQVRTLRFIVSGHVLVPELKYTIQLAFGGNDFEKDSSSPVFDAFVEYVKLRDLNVRFGQYFVPFDRARTIREFALQLVDRQIVVRELTLDRDFGLMLSSQDLLGLKGRLAYNLFVGSGDGRNRFADTTNPHGPQKPGVLTVGRLVLRPMGPFDDDQEADLTRSPKPRLAVGVAGAYNVASNRQRSTTGATYKLGTFDYVNAAADLVFKWHGFSMLTEAVLRSANKKKNTSINADGEAVTEWSQEGYGYFVQGGQMLTDKLEVTARWDHLMAEQGTDPAFEALVDSQGRQVGGGVNYYLNGHAFKLQSDYFFIFGESTEAARHALRFQLDASF